MSRMRVSPKTDERQPLYLQIQEHFKRLICAGEIGENDKFPTEKQLMEQFGVSRMTVSNALTKLAQEGWIYRIPGRGSFVNPGILAELAEGREQAETMPPDAGRMRGQGESASTRKMVGLVMPLLEDFFAIRLLRGIYGALKDTGYYVSIVLSHNCKEREKEAIQELIQQGAAGLFIFPIDAETYNEEILLLKIREYPFVLIDRYLPGFETHSVCSDNWMSAQLAVNHLWGLGHRDIAICSDIPSSTITVDERIRGYMEALKQKGAMINPALMLTDFQVDTSSPPELHPLYHHIRSRSATAYITLNLRLGMFVADVIKKLGLRAPQDISVITYDNPSSSVDLLPAFTHIDQHEEAIGARAAEQLLKLLAHQEKKLPEPFKQIVKSALVVGESTGALMVNK
ncbi:GntR family transcriptional regulator [Paenibacillus aestuarii]|uniref:GntR family transcriptional regulator n=1 Tax=Paenibacillus aestuarii TaxID=516965 RepID=A0ABW0K843_9BACL|nr:GntR family transcriptional regulator [Paenibacillus aestuarii]